MKDDLRQNLGGYGLAVTSVAVATALGYVLVKVITNPSLYPLYYLAILLTARFGGYRAAWLAFTLGALPLIYFRLSRIGNGLVLSPGWIAGMGAYLIIGSAIVLLIKAQHLAREAAENIAAEALEKQRLLKQEIADRKEAEQNLRTKDAQLRGLLDNTSAVVYLKDLEGRYLLVNCRFKQLFQPNDGSIIGKTDLDWFPESIARTFLESDAEVRRVQAPLNFEEVAPHDDGPHTYRSVKFPVVDEAGEMIAVGGISTDITDLKEAHNDLKAKQDLLGNLIEVQENEKQFLCHEFHDGLIQYAVGSLMLLEGYQRNHSARDDSAIIDKAIDNLRKGVEDGRRVIRGIRPAVLDDSGLEAAIEDLIDQFSTSGVMVTSNCDPAIGRLPESVQTTVYRVIQESLNNARKHSHTDVVRIELKKVDGDLHLEVRDFGCGFDVESARKRGFGLPGMTERVRLLGGECTIESEQNVGSRVIVRCPIPTIDPDDTL